MSYSFKNNHVKFRYTYAPDVDLYLISITDNALISTPNKRDATMFAEGEAFQAALEVKNISSVVSNSVRFGEHGFWWGIHTWTFNFEPTKPAMTEKRREHLHRRASACHAKLTGLLDALIARQRGAANAGDEEASKKARAAACNVFKTLEAELAKL